MAEDGAGAGDFIRQIVRRDLASGRVAGVVTRFPPEPNDPMQRFIAANPELWNEDIGV